MSRFASLRRMAVAGVVASFSIAGVGTAVAQDDAESAPSHPIHIHVGTCEELDPNPIAPLDNLAPRVNEDAEEESDNQPVGVLTAPTVLGTSSDEIELAWEDMLSASHAINVHMSDEDVQTYIACGDIGGVVVDDTLVISLQPLNDSGYTGIAILSQDGDGNVDVNDVYLAEPPTANEPTEVEATPVS